MAVKPVPEGYEGVIPYLSVHDAAAAIEFYEQAFGAVEIMRFTDPSSRVGHAEIRIGSNVVMLADEHPEMNFLSPRTRGGTPVILHVYVEDVDKTAAAFKAAGAEENRALENQFYGDRTAVFTDPFGHVWHIATRIEELTEDEINQRAAAMFEED